MLGVSAQKRGQLKTGRLRFYLSFLAYLGITNITASVSFSSLVTRGVCAVQLWLKHLHDGRLLFGSCHLR